MWAPFFLVVLVQRAPAPNPLANPQLSCSVCLAVPDYCFCLAIMQPVAFGVEEPKYFRMKFGNSGL